MSESTAVAVIEPRSAAMFRVLATAANDSGQDADKMERMYAIAKDMQERDASQLYAQAFAAMQPELPIITRSGNLKTRTRDGRDALDTKYAKFEDIMMAVIPIMSRHGFGLQFRTKMLQQQQQVLVIGKLMHRDGHSEEGEMMLPADVTGGKNAVQAFGSSISYGKRYVMVALLNIITEGEDTDGVPPGVDRETGEIRQQPRSTSSGPALCTDAQQRLLRAKMSDAGMEPEQLKVKFGVEHLRDLPFDQVNAALEFIRDPQADTVR